MALTGFSGIGTIYMAPVNVAGTKTGEYRKVGNAYPFSLQTATTQKSQISRLHDTAGQVLHVKNTIDEITGSLVLKQWNATNLAYALSGSATATSTAGSTVTDENVTALAVGEWAELDYPNVSSVVVQDVTDTTTYVLDTDYELDAELGMLAILSGGSISETDVLHVDYTYAAETGYEVNIGTNTLVRVAIRANIQNEYSSDKWQIEFYSVVLATSAGVNFISDPDSEGEEIPFTCTFETPSGQTTPGLIRSVPN